MTVTHPPSEARESAVLPLTTERLLLRSFVEEDFDGLYDIQSRPEVTQYLRWDARTPEQTREMLDRRVTQTIIAGAGDNLAIAVEHRESGALIADFNLDLIDAELRRAEIGFAMNPAHAGNGYATEAGRAVLRLAFEYYRFHRVIGVCNGRNTASMRLMERLGMRREGYFVQSEILKGKRVDVASYGILCQEWFGQHAAH
jgi:RimJ/RimL family protein N-acetyltransferase